MFGADDQAARRSRSRDMPAFHADRDFCVWHGEAPADDRFTVIMYPGAGNEAFAADGARSLLEAGLRQSHMRQKPMSFSIAASQI